MQLPKPKQDNKPWEWFRDGYNARPVVEDDAFRELIESIRQNGMLQPIGALENGVRIFGNRRFAAAKPAGLQIIPVQIYPCSITECQIRVINLTENVLRVDLSDPEIYLSCSELMKLNPEWTRKDLAAHVGKDPSTLTRWLCPDDLVPEAMQAFLDKRYGFAKAYSIVKSPNQLLSLDLVLKGETRDGLERHNKRSKSGNAPAVRASKIKLELGNVTVTISGDDLSLDDAIEAVVTAQKEMRKGRDQGLDARTLVAVCRDKAKAGA
jgi:ParB/RepB/Spo0J family partition protein